MKKIYVNTLFVLLFLGLTSAAGDTKSTLQPVWELKGANGQIVRNIVKAGNNIFAAAATNGVYRSSDNGQSWTAVNNGLSGQFIYSLAAIGNTVFAGTRDGVFMSDNAGASWVARKNGMPANSRMYTLLAVNTVLYGGSADGVLRSTDLGNTWTLSTNGFSVKPYVYSLVAQGNSILAGTQNTGIMKSIDNGISWISSATGIPAATTTGTLYVINSTELLAGTDGADGLYASTDQGATWKPSNSGINGLRVFALEGGNNIIYAGEQKGIYQSTNNGNTWTKMTVEGLAADAYINDVLVSGTTLMVGTDKGIYIYKT